MKNILSLVLGGLAVLLLSVSCAKEKEPSREELEQISFDAWMSLYGDGAEKQASGMYVKKLKSTTNAGAKTPSETTQWVRVNYTGRMLTSGDVFISRDPEIAKHQGTFEYYIHYIPDYLSMLASSAAPSNYYPIPGVYAALTGMKEGDIWRLYLPSNLAYGSNTYSSSNSYFAGQKSLSANTPIIMDLELVEVVDDAEKAERYQVQSYAVSALELGLSDTIGPAIYRKVLSTIADTDVKVEKDSVVQYYYVGRFLDGFVFDTNVKDTADKYHLSQYYAKSTYQLPLATTVGKSSDDDSGEGVVAGLDSTLHNISYGDVAECVFTSESMYGADGRFSTTSTIIPPHTPVIFQIWTSPKEGNGTDRFPYSIKGFQALQKEVDNVWVTGYAKGVVFGDNALNADDVELTPYPKKGVKDNILLATGRNAETNLKRCIPVELGTPELQAALNLTDNPDLFYTTPVKICGNVRMYKGTWGLVDISKYEIVNYSDSE